ncbi:hypothetical protein BGZ95_004758 [Linnemannia exigua]|uniref:Uncharacterized protein n=1 Tax=Linnemannia exigua TaxID=604196 RepID=A0AAD4D4C1_9FUNG|nr:hypothetical protein BGZ95_004758 [Linnemannia exigua]
MAKQQQQQQQQQLQQQHQQSGVGSKTPLLVLGAAALMIQGLLVFPTVNAETTVTTHNPIAVNDASITQTNRRGKISFDLGIQHNLQTIASLSTGGSGPAGAGPQLWAGSSSPSSFPSPSSQANATTPARQQEEKKQGQEQTAATAVLKDASLALYRKIRLEEESSPDAAAFAPSSLAANTHTTMTTSSTSTMKKQANEPIDNVLSGDGDRTTENDDIEQQQQQQQVASTEREAVNRNTPEVTSHSDTDTTAAVTAAAAAAANSDIQKAASKDVSAVVVEEEESLPPYSPSESDEKKKNKKKTSVDDNDDNDDEDDNTGGDHNDESQNDQDKKVTDEIVTETDTTEFEDAGDVGETVVEADDETPRVGDRVVLDKDDNLVKDVTLEKELQHAVKENGEAESDHVTLSDDKSTKSTLETTTPIDATEKGDKPLDKTPKPEELKDDEEEEVEEEEEEPQQQVEEKGDKKKNNAADPETTAPADDNKEIPGKKAEDEEVDNDKGNDEEEANMEEKKDGVDEAMVDFADRKMKKSSHRGQAFAKLREQLLKQQQQQQQQEQEQPQPLQQQEEEQMPQQKSPEDAEAPADVDLTAPTTPTPKPDDTSNNNDGTTTLVRAPDFVPQEDMRAVMNAKAEKDKREKPLIGGPLTPQQIADTEHQGANAFFELFAADVFPDVKLLGNNQLQDLDFEQRLKAVEGDATTIFSTSDNANKDAAKDVKDSKNDKSSSSSTAGSLPDAMKPNASGGPPDRNAAGPAAGQPQQRQQPASGPAAPASPSLASGAKGSTSAAAAPAGKGGSKDSAAGTAGFGTVPMFGPAQLDFGNGAASTLLSSSPLASKASLAFALAFGIAWMAL